MKKLNYSRSGVSVMRISQGKTYKLHALNCCHQLVATIYDSGFSNLSQVLRNLQRKAGDMSACNIKYVNVFCEDDNTYAFYRRVGNALIKDIL